VECTHIPNDGASLKTIKKMKTYKYKIDGKDYDVTIGEIMENSVTVSVNGVDYNVEMEVEPEQEKTAVAPVAQPADAASSNVSDSANVNTANALRAPLPGVITSIMVAVGDEVKKGDTVVVLEAMKMANNLEAEKDGKVTAICVKQGENVMEDTPLVVIE